jgi:hypothetical protein
LIKVFYYISIFEGQFPARQKQEAALLLSHFVRKKLPAAGSAVALICWKSGRRQALALKNPVK